MSEKQSIQQSLLDELAEAFNILRAECGDEEDGCRTIDMANILSATNRAMLVLRTLNNSRLDDVELVISAMKNIKKDSEDLGWLAVYAHLAWQIDELQKQ